MIFGKLFPNNLLASYVKNLRTRAKATLSNETISKSLKDSLKLSNFSSHSIRLFKTWVSQWEYILAFRIRKGHQLICIYYRFWNEKNLKELLRQLKLQLFKNRKDVMLAVVGASVYDWNTNRIKDEEMVKHFDAFNYAYLLKSKTISCSTCKDRQTYDEWSVFIEKQDMIVWRRPHSSGNFEYKVYGSYHDVSGEDFLNVQIDTKYRKEWDNTAIQLDIVEADPNTESNSDIIYWEMQWPKFFTNRDYVFNRRFTVDCDKKIIVIISQSTTHPSCPVQKDKYRVTDYFSAMVVKPYTELDKPGIEFVLTYFDNPGVNIPNSINSWVAMRAMPDFLTRLREATKHYKPFCERTGNSCICTLEDRSGERKRKKKKCDRKPKLVGNVANDEVFGLNAGELEKAFENIKENVEHKLDDIKDDIKKVLSKIKEDLKENYNIEDKNKKIKRGTNDNSRDDYSDAENNENEEHHKKKTNKEHPVKPKKPNVAGANKEAEEILISPTPAVRNEQDRKKFWRHFYDYDYYHR
ncbi:stAR-related lipid transfer protein 7, mitochondrial-like isoform X2 [Agrilus planipennis]|uniref:Phosphatidylcholine transfer protein n=1 Tax=Agrilus planipennis TaxID=224129 RepID=A0A1W4X5G9_AGRPL|nr:stAR-related lipid transfer protein 7, mitochondrial isoform X2 [Agrilus planipennis]XP_025837193.1 stAR-related lipid transfer protein 7, mitochondrial-like isoform X2 [Agrilus planipennis]